MTTGVALLPSAVMGKQQKEETEQINARIRSKTLARLEAYIAAQPYPAPLKGQCLDIAINEWLDKLGSASPPAAEPKRKK